MEEVNITVVVVGNLMEVKAVKEVTVMVEVEAEAEARDQEDLGTTSFQLDRTLTTPV